MTAVLTQIIEATDARPTGQDKYFGHCRHHGSKRNRDLSIKLEHDRIFIHCFAGCEPTDVCASLGLKLRDLFLDNRKSASEIRRERESREKKRLKEERKCKKEGAQLDTLREAELFIRTAQNIPDSHTWSDAKRHRLMNQLADAYAVIEKEEIHG